MTSLEVRFDAAMLACPLIAILRGITPDEAIDVGGVLIENGFRLIEVPLNSPRPFESIRRLIEHFGSRALIGAGTVTDVTEVAQLAGVGAHLVVSPHADVAVIRATRDNGLISLPGCATPTECFAALKAGATALKMFPMEVIGSAGVKAMRAVLPKSARLIAVGGVTPQTMPAFAAAGCNAFGLGSALYAPGKPATEVAAAAQAFAAALKQVRKAS